MESDSRSGPAETHGPSDAWEAYTSEAYLQGRADDTTRTAAAWLEEQSTTPFIQEVAARSLERLAVAKGDSVLEVGCGTGVFLPRLTTLVGQDGRVVGIDRSAAFLQDAADRVTAGGIRDLVELLEGDAQALPFDDDTFAAAHCERVLMHVEDPARAIAEMRRVVRPGGRVVVAEVFAAGATIDSPDPDATRKISDVLVSGIRNPWMGIQLRALFVEAGLTEVGGDVVGYFEEELDREEADEYTVIARDLAARGLLDEARAEAVIAAMEDRGARGTHCGLSVIFVVSGRVPDPSDAG